MINLLSGHKLRGRLAAVIESSNLPINQDSKIVIATRFVANLSPRERVGLYRFYVVGQGEDKITKDLRFEEGQFARLRSRLKGELSSHAEAKPS